MQRKLHSCFGSITVATNQFMHGLLLRFMTSLYARSLGAMTMLLTRTYSEIVVLIICVLLLEEHVLSTRIPCSFGRLRSPPCLRVSFSPWHARHTKRTTHRYTCSRTSSRLQAKQLGDELWTELWTPEMVRLFGPRGKRKALISRAPNLTRSHSFSQELARSWVKECPIYSIVLK